MDTYVVRVRQHVETCEFEALEAGLIRDRLLKGTRGEKKNGRMLRVNEMLRGHKEQFGDSTGVDITRYAQIVHWPLVEGQEITLATMGTLNVKKLICASSMVMHMSEIRKHFLFLETTMVNKIILQFVKPHVHLDTHSCKSRYQHSNFKKGKKLRYIEEESDDSIYSIQHIVQKHSLWYL